jgi:hypothetical protein
MRRSITWAAEDCAGSGSVMAPILASLASSRGSAHGRDDLAASG